MKRNRVKESFVKLWNSDVAKKYETEINNDYYDDVEIIFLPVVVGLKNNMVASISYLNSDLIMGKSIFNKIPEQVMINDLVKEYIGVNEEVDNE